MYEMYEVIRGSHGIAVVTEDDGQLWNDVPNLIVDRNLSLTDAVAMAMQMDDRLVDGSISPSFCSKEALPALRSAGYR